MASPPVLFFQFASKVLSGGAGRGRLDALSFPAQALNALAAQVVCLVLNHLLDQQRSSKTKLQAEAGKVLGVQVQPLSLLFRVNDQGYFQQAGTQAGVKPPCDTQISLQLADLLGAIGNPGSVARRAAIEGDMDFAQVVSTVINDLHWDPERDLARIIGDAQAVWVMNSLSAAGTNLRDVVGRLKASLREYVVHEKALTPSQMEFDQFREDMARLRDDIARLEKRIQRAGPADSQGKSGGAA